MELRPLLQPDMTAQHRSGSRDVDIDALRGSAILLVVVGHLIQYQNLSGYADNPIFHVIYSFHMPLFFFIGGIVFSRYGRSTSLKSLMRRSRSLVQPWLVWTAAIGTLFYFRDPSGLPLAQAIQFYWFLPVLLACHLAAFIFLASADLAGNEHLPLLIIVGLWLSTFLLNGFWISSIRFHAIFFAIGFLLDTRRDALAQWKFRSLLLPLTYIATTIFWIAILRFAPEEKSIPYYLSFPMRSAVALLGTVLVLQTVALLHMKAKLLLSVLGLYSLQIYLIHLLVIQFVTISSTPTSTAIWFVFLLLAPIALARLAVSGGIGTALFGR